MDTQLFIDMLCFDSTSGKEEEFSKFLSKALKTEHNSLQVFTVDGISNLLFSWGEPQIVFCTHMDTVPPYIPPTMTTTTDGDIRFEGRGTCDAKGQIFSLFNACLELEKQGATGFGLLLLSGEETGSFGAKAFRDLHPGGEYVIVGEPTDNYMVSASKGTLGFGLCFKGKSFHSGYPEMGESAVSKFVEFMNLLKTTSFPTDELMGETTYNIGKLISDNPQNILSNKLTCRLYFRTTTASHQAVSQFMQEQTLAEFTANGGDTPMHYTTLPHFPTKTVAFGSDAPQLTNFKHKILCGPGSILVAHRDEEFILLSQIEKAISNYTTMFTELQKKLNASKSF